MHVHIQENFKAPISPGVYEYIAFPTKVSRKLNKS